MNLSSGSSYSVTRNISLNNLLRDVTEIEVIRGIQQIIYPSEIQETVLDNLVEGATHQAGDFSLELTALGMSVEIEIRELDEIAEDETRESDRELQERIRQRMDDLIVKYSPRDAEGNAMGVTMDMSGSFFDSYTVRFSTNEPPASIHLKIISKVSEIEYPIELKNIPLNRHAEMPEKLESLAFTGHDAPLSVEFIEIRKDPNFPPEHAPDNIVVRITNHSNKDALNVRTVFVYLDERGTELESSPNTLTGTYTQDGQEPVAKFGATVEVETTAFFMPDETTTVRIDLQEVKFIDGTTWRSEMR